MEQQTYTLMLPCMVGDTVYKIWPHTKSIEDWTVTEVCVFGREPDQIVFRLGHEGKENDCYSFCMDELGERWFLNQAAAEEALKARAGHEPPG